MIYLLWNTSEEAQIAEQKIYKKYISSIPTPTPAYLQNTTKYANIENIKGKYGFPKPTNQDLINNISGYSELDYIESITE